jgi:hypothetical protein
VFFNIMPPPSLSFALPSSSSYPPALQGSCKALLRRFIKALLRLYALLSSSIASLWPPAISCIFIYEGSIKALQISLALPCPSRMAVPRKL